MAVFSSIGASIFGAGTFLATLTAGALQVAAGIALSYIAKAIAGEPERAKFGTQIRLQGGDDVPRSIIFGRAATSGSLVYANSWGTGNAFYTRVIALSDYPVKSLLRIFVNGAAVELSATPHPNRGYPVIEYRRGSVDHMWVKFYDGSQTAADSYLTGTVSTSERPYQSTRVGVGVAYAIVTFMAPERHDDEESPLFTGGVPDVLFEISGARLFDPTDADQDWSDPDTWGGPGDDDPTVQVYNILRGIHVNDGWLYGLQNISVAQLPAITRSDYVTGGEIQVGAQIKDALETILTGCQGRLTEVGGAYKLHVGAPGAASVTILDNDILSTEEQTFTPILGLEDTVNGILAKYPNPDEAWAIKTAPPMIRTDLEALAGNRRLMANVTLDMVYDPEQVQRLIKSALLEAQRARRHTVTMGPEFWVLEPGDYVAWTSERNGYVDKLFRVDGIADQPDLNILADITEVDPSDYDWNPSTDYTPPIDGPIDIVSAAALPLYGWQVLPATIRDQDGEARRPSIEVRYNSGLSGVRSVRVEVRVAGETAPMFNGEVPYASPFATVLAAQFSPDTEYEVRGIFVREGGLPSEWSSWLSVTTPDVRLGASDISLELDELFEGIAGKLEWVGGAVRQLIEDFRSVGSIIEESDRENYTKRETLSRELRLQMNGLEASFTEIIEVALGPGGAIATALSSLYAAMGGNDSQVNVRWEAVAAPTGYAARYAIQAAVNDGSFRAATFFMDVPADPNEPTRIVLGGGQIILATGSNPNDYKVALLAEDGEIKFAGARAGRITSADGESMIIDFDDPEIRMEST